MHNIIASIWEYVPESPALMGKAAGQRTSGETVGAGGGIGGVDVHWKVGRRMRRPGKGCSHQGVIVDLDVPVEGSAGR